MAAIEVGINTDDWYKIERSGWVGAAGWGLLAVAVGIFPFRMYPFYWFTGLRIESMADPIIVGLIAIVSLILAMAMFSQPRMSSAERESGRILIETGFTQVQETEIPFAEVASVSTGAHPLLPIATRVSVVTKSGKKVPFAWDMDKGTADGVAAALNAILSGGSTASAAPAADSAPAEEAAEAAEGDAPGE